MSVASSAEKPYLIGIEKIRFLYLSEQRGPGFFVSLRDIPHQARVRPRFELVVLNRALLRDHRARGRQSYWMYS